MDNKDLFRRIKELNLTLGKYALFGSAPICIRGWKDLNHDLDVIVWEDIFEEYKIKPGWEIRRMDHGSEYLWNDELELWKDWKPGIWDIKELTKNAEIIDGLPFVRLEHVLKWKKLNGRQKDLKDVEIIEKNIR